MEKTIMTTYRKLLLAAVAALIAAIPALPAIASDRNQGIVIGVHNEEATDAFVKTLNLQPKLDGGRFAVVQMFNGGYGNASFALVYVPRNLGVRKNDIVQMAPTSMNLLENPGKGVVIKVDQDMASCK
jgi:hypothetical protein